MTKLPNGMYQADDGKVWQNKATLAIGGSLLLLGCKDSLDNWQEINKPVET